MAPSSLTAASNQRESTENAQARARNVIVFGETGAGKSSVINMLQGGGDATVSDGAAGVTFAYARYPKTIRELGFTIFDTAGLNETVQGSVPPSQAIEQLYKLIHELEDGITLLMYVMRAPRLKSTTQKNYEIFSDSFCEGRVPIVIVITGLEYRQNMEEWWTENELLFRSNKMLFKGHACITSTQGKLSQAGKHVYEQEYHASKRKVEDLIYQFRDAEPWRMPSKTWINNMVIQVYVILAEMLHLDSKAAARDLRYALQRYGGLSKEEAALRAMSLERTISRRLEHSISRAVTPSVVLATPLPAPIRSEPMGDSHAQARNMIVFGETGAGKSSVINMLENTGRENALVTSEGAGATFAYTHYARTVRQVPFEIFETAALNEPTHGSVPPSQAIELLYKLVRDLKDGISLLVYVMRAPHLKSIARKNYELFHDVFCEGRVPIVIVITGLESEDNMEDWWTRYEGELRSNKMFFKGYACITSTRGKFRNGEYLFEQEYHSSREKIEELIHRFHNTKPWTNLDFKTTARDLRFALQTYGGLSKKEATLRAKWLEKAPVTSIM